MRHLFGNILTRYGSAANNRGAAEGNITPLQKIVWKGETHSSVSAEAIRWALRYYWQKSNHTVNRIWDEERNQFHFTEPDFDPSKFIDDDVLGYMRAEAAKVENSAEADENSPESASEPNDNKPKGKGRSKSRKKPQGIKLARKGALEITRAVSTSAYSGDITFNAVSNEKGRTSLYGTEFHATRYQYGFAITPSYLKEPARIFAVLDGLLYLSEVAGNHGRFLYDFSPEQIILRWTHDFCPRFLYSFEEDEDGQISCPDLVRQIGIGDIEPQELWMGGQVASDFEEIDVKSFSGIKAVIEDLKATIRDEMNL
jgi:CRISPR-associated protein Cst2